ncbi:kinase-like protein [Penicillium hispanicum]|uniref:kinase-like protein n=1 Tax=Penicillium hispanicum TaxID=1080232 RepID=UPI00254069A0|nr:kinase-like protein [Penicillium hispanicum]KAJ5591923.1 kinase-like protein [Penicillium hispanicum]
MFKSVRKRWIFDPPTRNTVPSYKRISMSALATQKLYSYTSGRFLFNEELRLRECYVELNTTALMQETEKILGPAHGRVASIVKLAEGGFNRVFLLNMDDGFEAILKIPFHLAGPKYYATASEAATLQYLHSKGIPVPKVYGYASSANSPAGVEYLLMEKAQGVCLQSRWRELTKRQQHKLATSFVEIEKKFFDIPFGSIGSLYFKADIPLELQGALYMNTEPNHDSETFCIGPTADYLFWYGKRADFNLHRGPWNDPIEYFQSIAQKEQQWTRRYGKPVELDFPHNGIFPGEKNPEEYLDLLHKYLAMTPYLLPEDPASHKPTLRHPDLNPNNIFISPDTGAISCIIDWQHTTVKPRLLVAGYPRAFENPDPEESPDLKEPSLPLDYKTLSTEAKAEADELFRRRLLFHYYRVFNGGLNKAHLNTLRDPLLRPRQHLIEWAGRQWSGNLITLKGALIRMVQYWPYLQNKGASCPIHFTKNEMKEFLEQEQQWFEVNAVVNLWREQIGGINEDGWVSNEQYEEAVQKVAELKESLIALGEADQDEIELLEKGWPFRDHQEEY